MSLLNAAPFALAATSLSAAAVLAHAVFSPAATALGPVQCTVGENQVALTFDDGPHPAWTPQILDVLAKFSAPATFFMVGRAVAASPATARAVADAGHALGNHSMHHHLAGVAQTQPYWHAEWQDAADALFAHTGRRTNLCRPPMGYKTWHSMAAARRLGLRTVGWRRRALDARGAPAQAITRRIISALRGGDILLLHDGVAPGGTPSRAGTVAALPLILHAIHDRGLRCVSVGGST